MKIVFADYCIEAPSDASPAAIATHCRQELARLTAEDPAAASALAAAIDELVLEFSSCLGVPDEPPEPDTTAPSDAPEPEKSKRKKKREELVNV